MKHLCLLLKLLSLNLETKVSRGVYGVLSETRKLIYQLVCESMPVSTSFKKARR